MQIWAKLEGVEELLARLARGAQAAQSGSARTQEAFRLIGSEECEHQRAEFIDRSRGGSAGGVGWKPISPLTALLRRSGRTRKLAGWSQLVEIARTLPILIDTGRLAASLAPGASGNVLAPDGMGVTFGTSVPYAARQHAGGPGDEPAPSGAARRPTRRSRGPS